MAPTTSLAASTPTPTTSVSSPSSRTSTSKPAILLIGDITHARKEWEALDSIANLKYFTSNTRSSFISACQSGEYDDVVAIYRSNESTSLTGLFDEELISSLPSSLKFIAHNGAGYDNISIPSCTARGISVSSTPIAVNSATADIAIFLLLGALRRIQVPLSSIRASSWRGKSELGRDPQGKVLGILGMGGIGREVARRAKAFGMKIQYFNRRRLSEEIETELGAEWVDFEQLLKTSDVLSLNCSLKLETVGIIGKKEFVMMKDGVTIVNTARGKLIDEAALVEALEGGKVWSAGLDVYEEEPVVHEALLSNPNVVLLPHIGTATKETQRNMELLVLENIQSALKKGVLVTQVAEQCKKESML